ncbi:MAG: AsmA-like C-terminal region-containing protein, partial [Rhodobacterales bacterium]|nr:AsmA-like C-terminal region-containing protein [Rhodobacterales bacterium]
KMFGGTADITGTVDARGRVPAVDTTVKVAEVDLVQASQSTSGKTLASGRFSLDTRLTARGGSQADMVRTLGGDGRFDLRNVDVKSAATGTAAASLINLLASLNKLGGASKGASADIGGTYRIDRGILTTNDLALASGLGNGQAQGTVNLPAWTIDLDGRIKMSQSALTQILASKVREVRQVQDLPFSVKGPLDAPDVHVDTASLPSGGVAIPGLDKGLDKLRKKKGLGALIDQIAPQQQGTTTGSGGVPDPAPTVPVTRPRAGDTLAPPPPPSSGGGTAGQTQPAGKADVLQQVLPGLLNKLGK